MEFCLSALGCTGETEYQKPEYLETENEPDAYPFSATCSYEKLQDIKAAEISGKTAFQNRNFRLAIKEYSKGIQHFTPCANEEATMVETENLALLTELLFYRSVSYCNLAEYENSLYDSRAIISLRPNWAQGYIRKGEAFLGLKLYAKAKEAYETSQIHVTNSLRRSHL